MPTGVSAPPPHLPAPLYQGSVNTWECDDGGHMNVRFHFERAMIGLAHMAHALEMPRAFTQAAGATLAPLEIHARFLKEARPGAPLIMRGGIAKMDESEALLCLDMRHADGSPSSVFNIRAAHADTRGFRAFAWPQRARAAAKRLHCALPAHAKPRSIDVNAVPSDISVARADELGALRIGGTMVMAEQCDAFGRLRGEQFVGRVSDSVPTFLSRWRHEIAGGKLEGGAPAGAVVESRLIFRRFPRAGDLIEIRSGVAEVGEKTLRLVHWLCDPESGAAWASMEAVALTFDTATRKAIAPSADVRARMQARVLPMAI
mgnify:CR=1 FL=1